MISYYSYQILGKIKNVYIGVDHSPDEIKRQNELFKELCDVFGWYYDEILGIDPHIVDHEIKTYLNAKPVRQWLREMNPPKAPAIKAKIEKLLKASFIYLVPLIKWVSNPIPVDKK